MERFRNNFYLETMIPQYTDNLRSLRGFKFDWTRNDANFDHVYANQAFTHKLNELGAATLERRPSRRKFNRLGAFDRSSASA